MCGGCLRRVEANEKWNETSKFRPRITLCVCTICLSLNSSSSLLFFPSVYFTTRWDPRLSKESVHGHVKHMSTIINFVSLPSDSGGPRAAENRIIWKIEFNFISHSLGASAGKVWTKYEHSRRMKFFPRISLFFSLGFRSIKALPEVDSETRTTATRLGILQVWEYKKHFVRPKMCHFSDCLKQRSGRQNRRL